MGQKEGEREREEEEELTVQYSTGLGERVVPRLRELASLLPEGVRRRDSRNLGTTLCL